VGIDAGRAIDLSGIVSRPASAGSPRTSAGESSLTLPGLALQADESTFSTVIEISATVPVVVCFVHDLAADEAMIRTLTDAVTALAGKTILVSVDAQANPQLVGSFRVDAIAAAEGGASPVVAAVIGGRPLPLFAGTQSAEAIAQLLQQLVTVAAENGVNGVVTVPRENGPASPGSAPNPATNPAAESASESTDVVNSREPGESGERGESGEPLAPLHREAFDAIEAGDYATAVAKYERALVENPRDHMARAGLAQVSLLHRLQGKTLADVRRAAAAHPHDLASALDVADLDVSGGHIEDAFERLLGFFATASADERDVIRTRLLQLFEVVGVTDLRVNAARSRLSSMLY